MNNISTSNAIAILIVGMLILTSFSIVAIGNNEKLNETITVNYQFSKPIVQQITLDNTIYDQVIMQGAPSSGDPGEPQLPVFGAYILLPQNIKEYTINLKSGEKILVDNNLKIVPGATPVPLSIAESAKLPEEDPVIYNSNNLFPGELYTEVDIYSLRGYKILVLMIHPVQYNPASGQLWYYSDIEISIDTTKIYDENEMYRGLEKDKKWVQNRVDNPGLIYSYSDNPNMPLEEYDMLIITTEELEPGFEILRDAHNLKGTQTIIKTLTDVGSSNADDIRDYIRDAYNNWGIEYVLIGGDHDVVPAKILWVYGLDEGTTPYETYMPSDLYYSCLDGPYNYDGDAKWGEPTDGENGGDVDLFADVYVGRACVGNLEEVGFFVNKTIAQLNLEGTEEYLQECVLAGEYLGNYGIASWGGNYLDLMVDGCDLDGYVTAGIPSEDYTITKLYDREYPGNDWPVDEIITLINNGTYMLHHDGHSNYYYNMKMTIDDVVDYIENDDEFCFIYSVGCMAGGFDNGDCIAEYLNSKTPYGAFAVIMNARYGWFWAYSTDGDGTRYTREFCDAIYGEDITVISKANQDSKEDNLYMIERSCMRWTYYQLNLFGDPSLAFFTPDNFNNAPDTPIIDGPSQAKAGIDLDFTVVTSDLDDDQVYYYVDWGDGNNSGWIGPFDPDDEIPINHTYAEQGSYEIKVKAKDAKGAESDWAIFPVEVPRGKTIFITNFIEFVKTYFPKLYTFFILILKN